jgi:S1-C subfamily serine protease
LPIPTFVLGLKVAPVTIPSATAILPGASAQGLRIVSVVPGGAAARAGLEPGDILLTANGIATTTLDALDTALAQCQGVLTLTVRSARFPHRVVPVTVFPHAAGTSIATAPGRRL